MIINTALILCAGFGKRMRPATLIKPKPLIEINGKNLLMRSIELIVSIGIKKIKLNSHYLSDQILSFVKNCPYKDIIDIVVEGEQILDTGGGVKNLMKNSNEKNFIVLNPDTIWEKGYKKVIVDMIKNYQINKLNNLLLVVNKKYSYDKRLKSDFHLQKNKLTKNIGGQHIYTVLQIINKNLFKNINDKKFPMNKIWDKEIKKFNLNGFESNQKFIHLSDIMIFNKLIKK